MECITFIITLISFKMETSEKFSVKTPRLESQRATVCCLGTINPHFTADYWYQLHLITSLPRYIHTVKQPHPGSLFRSQTCLTLVEVAGFSSANTYTPRFDVIRFCCVRFCTGRFYLFHSGLEWPCHRDGTNYSKITLNIKGK